MINGDGAVSDALRIHSTEAGWSPVFSINHYFRGEKAAC